MKTTALYDVLNQFSGANALLMLRKEYFWLVFFLMQLDFIQMSCPVINTRVVVCMHVVHAGMTMSLKWLAKLVSRHLHSFFLAPVFSNEKKKIGCASLKLLLAFSPFSFMFKF